MRGPRHENNIYSQDRPARGRRSIHGRTALNAWPLVVADRPPDMVRGARMTYYRSKAAAQALADELTLQDRDAWRYDVQACPRGFYVAVFDDDGHFLGVL